MFSNFARTSFKMGIRRRQQFNVSTLVFLFTGIFWSEFAFSSGYSYHHPLSPGDIRSRPRPNPRGSQSQTSPSHFGYADTYDFIVVGGGTAGCAMASRLSENGRHSVLLLEAGGMPDPRLDIPAMSAQLIGEDSEYTVWHRTVPQENAGLMNGGVVNFIRGNTLGGSSQVNYMMFNRGSPHDYDNWANITGDDSRSYRNMLKYFKRSEDYLIDPNQSEQHGYGGPIGVSRPNYAPVVDVWLAAGRSLGYPIAYPNGPQRISFTPHEFARRSGRRVSSYTGYIKQYMNSRKNLKVIVNAEARKLEFDGKKAIGVWYTDSSTAGNINQTRILVKARKEIIVSGGVIGSPVLLLKSGVGPRVELDKIGISPVQILPVGENLQDHAFTKIEVIINNRSLVIDGDRDLTPEAFKLYQETGDGPYASSFGYDGQAFLASDMQQRTGLKDWADIQLMFIGSEGVPSTIPPLQNFHRADWEAVIGCGVLGARPKSRGTVRVNPMDLDGLPLVDFRYNTHPDDMEVTVDGIKKLLRVFEKSPEFRRLGARLPTTPFPRCEHLKFRSDEYWKCYVRQVTGTAFHGSGTCAMGKGPSDKNAVVDTKLRVIGLGALRVVDASIMPTVTNANTHAPTYGIAEKAAEMILQDWK